MKNSKLIVIFIAFLMLSCSKGGTTNTPTTPPAPMAETSIAFTVNVDPGSGGVLAVVGSSQPIIVKVTSAIPTAGVTVTLTVTKDLDNSTVYTNSVSSTTTDNSLTITGLTPGVLCTATVVVTSKSTTSNTKTSTFKLAAK